MSTKTPTRRTAVPKTTSTRKTTTRTTTPRTRKAPAAKPKPAPETVVEAAPESKVVDLPLPAEDHPSLRKKELVDLAVARSGIKKRDAKPAIEAALSVLGEALAEGRELNLQPFGKLKVTRMKKGGNGQIINARVRQPDEADRPPLSPLAQPAE